MTDKGAKKKAARIFNATRSEGEEPVKRYETKRLTPKRSGYRSAVQRGNKSMRGLTFTNIGTGGKIRAMRGTEVAARLPEDEGTRTAKKTTEKKSKVRQVAAKLGKTKRTLSGNADDFGMKFNTHARSYIARRGWES